MRKWLKDDQVLFGLLRMGFGSGTFRRTKWLFLHWSGYVPRRAVLLHPTAASHRQAFLLDVQ